MISLFKLYHKGLFGANSGFSLVAVIVYPGKQVMSLTGRSILLRQILTSLAHCQLSSRLNFDGNAFPVQRSKAKKRRRA